MSDYDVWLITYSGIECILPDPGGTIHEVHFLVDFYPILLFPVFGQEPLRFQRDVKFPELKSLEELERLIKSEALGHKIDLHGFHCTVFLRFGHVVYLTGFECGDFEGKGRGDPFFVQKLSFSEIEEVCFA